MRKTNLELWSEQLELLNSKTAEFINEHKAGREVPEVYFVAHSNGKLAERHVIGTSYSHFRHGGKTYFSGKKPTKKEVEALTVYANSEIPFTLEHLYFEYSETYTYQSKGETRTGTSKSAVSWSNLINQNGLFWDKKAASERSEQLMGLAVERAKFQEEHKKDASYDYKANDYKFLGWQNGWKHVYYDEDGGLCSETGKPKKTFGYTKEDYPEYKQCIDSDHMRIEVQHRQSGSENTVSCPTCKIYWKYDCSD